VATASWRRRRSRRSSDRPPGGNGCAAGWLLDCRRDSVAGSVGDRDRGDRILGRLHALVPRAWLSAALILMCCSSGPECSPGLRGRWRFVGVRDAARITAQPLIAGVRALLVLHWLRLVDTVSGWCAPTPASTSCCRARAARVALAAQWGVARCEFGRELAPGGDHRARRVRLGVIKNLLASPKLLLDPIAAVDDDRNKRAVGCPACRWSVRSPSSRRSCGSTAPTRSSSPSLGHGEPDSTRGDACLAVHIAYRIAPDPRTY